MISFVGSAWQFALARKTLWRYRVMSCLDAKPLKKEGAADSGLPNWHVDTGTKCSR